MLSSVWQEGYYQYKRDPAVKLTLEGLWFMLCSTWRPYSRAACRIALWHQKQFNCFVWVCVCTSAFVCLSNVMSLLWLMTIYIDPVIQSAQVVRSYTANIIWITYMHIVVHGLLLGWIHNISTNTKIILLFLCAKLNRQYQLTPINK